MRTLHLKYIAYSLPVVLLVACSSHEESLQTLKNEIAAIYELPPEPIELIPELQSITPMTYSAHSLRDPFSPPQERLPETGTGISPDLNRQKEALEFYPLDTLRMVGTLSKANTLWAVIQETSDKGIHKVQVGEHLGKNYGEITKITQDTIELIEIIPDGAGGWVERNASIKMSTD